MDLLEEIKRKIDHISEASVQDGVRAAVRHIEVAERWLYRGREEQNDDMYNDVIYRSNQAFEGMLKEAYSVLTGSNASKMTPNQIEKVLIRDSVFTSRVMDLFTNYRTEWRNTSTHDHRLFFNDQEALLAIVSVSAFATILIDQLVEASSSKQEKDEISKHRDKIIKRIGPTDNKSLRSIVTNSLLAFTEELQREGHLPPRQETEIIGRLTGFLESIDLGFKLEREPSLGGSSRLRPDMIISRGDEAVIIELKLVHSINDLVKRGVVQLQRYLEVFGVRDGIIYVPPSEIGKGMDVSVLMSQGGGEDYEYQIVLVGPSHEKVA